MANKPMRWLGVIASLAFFMTLTGCSSIPLIGKSKFELQIRGVPTEDTLSLFVVMAEDGVLGDTSRPQNIEKAIHPDRVSGYELFAQFEPLTDGAVPWRQVSMKNNVSDWVEIELDDKEALLLVEVETGALEDFASHAVLVVVSTRKAWFAEKILSRSMTTTKGISLEIQPKKFVRKTLE